jgi:anti-sigma regulatory factor (Ser/Thr protein kinase)
LPETSHIQITSDTCNVVKVRLAVIEAAQRIGFTETEVSAIALAIDEAICNVIKHGYRGQAGQPIEVLLEPLSRQGRMGLQVTIQDRAPQVDPACPADWVRTSSERSWTRWSTATAGRRGCSCVW